MPARYACQAVGNVWLGFALYYGGLMAALTIAGAGIRALRGGRRGGERYGAALCLSLCGALALFGYGLVHTKNRMTPGELLSGADQSAPILVLQHEPVEFGSLAEAGADVALCGHTHAGQIFPGNLIVPFFNENAWGYKRVDGLDTYVTAGVGYYGPPMRVGTDSEVTIIRMSLRVGNDGGLQVMGLRRAWGGCIPKPANADGVREETTDKRRNGKEYKVNRKVGNASFRFRHSSFSRSRSAAFTTTNTEPQLCHSAPVMGVRTPRADSSTAVRLMTSDATMFMCTFFITFCMRPNR